jgi:tetratricopeptide (TPR) repeat protein
MQSLPSLQDLKDALVSARRRCPVDHQDISDAVQALAGPCASSGDRQQALKLFKELLEIYDRTLPPHDLLTIACKSSVAAQLTHLGRQQEALVLYREVLESREGVLPSNHPDVSKSMSNLATVYCMVADYKASVDMLKRALQFGQGIWPSNSIELALPMCNLAVGYIHTGQFDEALVLFELALVIRRAVLASDHPSILRNVRLLAQCQVNRTLQLSETQKRLLIISSPNDTTPTMLKIIVERTEGQCHPALLIKDSSHSGLSTGSTSEEDDEEICQVRLWGHARQVLQSKGGHHGGDCDSDVSDLQLGDTL